MNKFLFFISFQIICQLVSAQTQVSGLLVESRENPLGIDEVQPRFTWLLKNEKRNVLQTAYEIIVSADSLFNSSGSGLIWNTGKVNSDSSVHVAFKGPSLHSGQKYYWWVRVWDNSGNMSDWSKMAFWQMGLIRPSDWKAKWIGVGYKEDTLLRPSPMFRKQINTSKKIQSASLFITAHGLYEAYINGNRVGDAYFTPGWTSYQKRLQYQTFDVTQMLSKGSNVLAVQLGNGWYRGIISYENKKNVYGKDLALIFQLVIKYQDGTIENVISDETWKSSTGPIRFSEIYNGEIYDENKFKQGWMLTGYNDKEWAGVKVFDITKNNLIATSNEPVRKHEMFKPIKFIITPKGEKVLDFGQNLVGWVQIKIKGKAKDTITISHAEVLDKNGNFYIENLRAAKATDKYISKGMEEMTFEPHFTFHGFRYIKIEGLSEAVIPENYTAIALYSDMKPTGTFSTSNILINQLQHNIQWGQKGNFLDVPTDCPQRDERLGWTGDAQVFSRTAAFNMNVNSFFSKWLRDVEADQLPDGSVPFVIPNILGPGSAATGWADVATIIPWNIYLSYGDKRVLERQYTSMKAWVDYMRNQSKNDLWNTGFHFGDWLSFMQDNDVMGRSAITDKYLIAQCFWAYSTQLLIKAARVLNREDDVNKYTPILQKIKDAFLKEYVTPNGRLVSNTQTAYVLALNFDMLPDSLRSQALDRLVQNIGNYGNHLSTGFLGTPYLCHVLSRFGRSDVAYQLLLQQSFPSWLYPVKMGATTIWERWNGIRPDSTFEPASMNSFNHYAYGAIGEWMYRVIAGLDTYEDAPGYKHIKVKPHIGGGFTNASMNLETYYGPVRSEWKTLNGNLAMDVEIPVNTYATIYIPGKIPESIKESGNDLSTISDIKIIGAEDGYVIVRIGSGEYHFTSNSYSEK